MMRKVTLFLSLFSLLFLLAACQSAGSSVSGAVSSGNTSSGTTSSPSTSGSSSSNGSASSGGSSAPSGSGSASSGTDSSQPPAQSGDASQSSSQSEPEPQPEPVKPSNNHTLYILMYHSVVDGDGSNCNDWMTTTQRFREDLQWLKDHGYTTLLPSELENGASLPEKAVLITFDDGYANNYTQAFPVLKEFQAKAVISMIVRRTVDGKPDFLTWDMCREMANSGLVEIGSHTYDHHANDPRGIKRMNGESRKDYEARIFSDLEKSISLIEENVGKPVTFFAYPHGQTEPWASDFLKEHFAMTVTTQHGPANVSHGLYDLSRHNINFKEPLSKYLPA
ncbi:polysaccharide deacetylase family protein [Pseudoflavonifractor sp. AF19-9AC]|uniref:polysaccharide deacetylase family protein n=1 Tax=Pseudoflavonifractor sp. AF19-9AC TaxID=2292244 RepID=UPI0018F7661A|nr:polysaccharide deacetylase family protein [Pseudoflavonifractor sp. AF19-9AC]